MTLIFVDQGESLALQYLVNKAEPQDLVLRLFTNDVTNGLNAAQIEALTEAAFTEATFPGYAPVTLTGANWTLTPGDPAQASYARQDFQATADTSPPQTIYGYYLTRASGGELIAFEYFTGPAVIEFDGDFILVTPRITAQDTQD